MICAAGNGLIRVDEWTAEAYIVLRKYSYNYALLRHEANLPTDEFAVKLREYCERCNKTKKLWPMKPPRFEIDMIDFYFIALFWGRNLPINSGDDILRALGFEVQRTEFTK